MKSQTTSRANAIRYASLFSVALSFLFMQSADAQNILASRTPVDGGSVEIRNATQGTSDTVPPGTFATLNANVNDIIEVEAIPEDGYEFVRWDGNPPDGNQNTEAFLYFADINRAMTAVFEPIEPLRLIITKESGYAGSGDGDLFVSVNGGPSLPYDPAAIYQENDSVVVTAVPVPVGVFDSFMLEWLGDIPDSWESIEDRKAPHDPILPLVMNDNKEITVVFSREYHAGEGVGDLDLDGLPDRWELSYGLDPRDGEGDNGPDGNVANDFSMPTGWPYNRFGPGDYPADITGLQNYNATEARLEWPYRFHLDGSRPLNYYVGSESFNNWLHARGFDGWYGDNPVTGINDDRNVNPTELSTGLDAIPDGWKYWFYGSAINDPDMEGERLDYTLGFDPDDPDETNISWDWDDLKVIIPNAAILNLFSPSLGVDVQNDLDDDCLTMLEEFLNGTDPIHWDTDGDGISDGYEVRTGLNPLDPEDGDANLSDDHMAYYEDDDGNERRHRQVYDALGFDPRTGWGANYLGRGEVRELRNQVNTIPFNSREQYMASVYLAWRAGAVFDCQNFDNFALDPFSIDTDDDGMFDGWELYVGLNPKDPEDANVDEDDDGLTNFQEFSAKDIDLIRGTPWPNGRQHFDPVWYNKVWPTDPWDSDTDGDGLSDGAEGGYRDLDLPEDMEVPGGLAALKYAPPGLSGAELAALWNGSCYHGGGLNPTSVDTDGDGIPDHWEATYRSTRYSIDDLTDRNGMDGTVKDELRDYDGDGLLNYQEYLTGAIYHWRYITDWVAGLPLGGYDPFDFFTGVPYEWDWHSEIKDLPYFFIEPWPGNTRVFYSSTNPRQMDSDWDGMDDYWEVFHGLNPTFGVIDIHASMVFDAPWVAAGVPPTFDIRVAPYVAGSPFADPDQDGLPNSEESLQVNVIGPDYYHTDPSPGWVTDTSYQRSFVNLYYSLGMLEDHWWFGPRGATAPTYMFSFASNEGFDTDGDMIGDRAELVHSPSSPGTTDPLSVESPPRRRALHLNGDAAARTRGKFLHGRYDLTEFTVEVWVRAVNPAAGHMQVIVERPIKIPNGNIMGHPEGIRRNFRIALDENGHPFASYTGFGFDGINYEDVIASSIHPLEPDRWYHLTAKYDWDAATLYLYVDGVMRKGTPSAERPINSWTTGNPAYVFDAPLVVGAADKRPDGRVTGMPIWVGPAAGLTFNQPDLDHFFEGWVDELRIWNGARSSEDIARDRMRKFKMADVAETLPEPGFVATEPELLYLYNFNNLLDPVVEGVVPLGFEFLNGRPDDGSYPHVPWWGTADDRSLLYDNYFYVPWIVNLAARLPLDPPLDSPYHTATYQVGNLIFHRDFPNTANPYNLAYLHSRTFGGELHPDFFQGTFNPARSPLLNDLLPLRFARIDATVELWDGGGTGLDPYDSNGDGIPDCWYLEHGYDPLGPSIAEEDPNENGINNYWSYRLGADPFNAFSLDPAGIISDADWDSDGDGLSNYDEINIYFTDPTNPDTDDDGIPDGQEVLDGTDPRSSISPFILRALRFGEVGGIGTVSMADQIGLEATERFSLGEFTIEALVRPDSLPVNRVTLLRRSVQASGRLNYQLGLTSEGRPFLRFEGSVPTSPDFAEVIADDDIPLHEWTHVAVRYDRAAGELAIFIDGELSASKTTSLLPAMGPGDLLLGGDGFVGDLKEIRIWGVPRTEEDIQRFYDRNLFFGAGVIDPGVLRVYGDDGHLQQISSTRDPITDVPIDSLGNNWTLEAWIKTDSTSSGTIISRWNAADGQQIGDYNYFLGMTADGKLLGRFSIVYELVDNPDEEDEEVETVINTTINNIQGVTSVNDGQWHHVAYVRDSQHVSLYVNGLLDQRQPRTLVPLEDYDRIRNTAVRRLAGPLTAGYGLAADLDEVRVWNRALSGNELRMVNTRSLVGNEPGLITYFNFDYQRGDLAEERSDLRDPEEEYGRYINTAERIATLDVPPIEVNPVITYRLTLAGYFPADDGGVTLEDFIYPLDAEFAGTLSGDVSFQDLDQVDYPYTQDRNEDGIPNWWYILLELDPSGESVADENWDGTGLPNYWQYRLNADPHDPHSLWEQAGSVGSPVNDADFDSDGDGLSNIDEVMLHGTDPTLPDTDNDGWDDGFEVRRGTSPVDALSPDVQRALALDGTAGAYLELSGDSRFALADWTLSGWFRADSAVTGNASLIGREVEMGQYNYRLGWWSDAMGSVRPSIEFNAASDGSTVRLWASNSVPVGVWTHMSATFDSTEGRLSLYLDGMQVRTMITEQSPKLMPQSIPPVVGRLFNGLIDEVAIYDRALDVTEVEQVSGIGANLRAEGMPEGLVGYYKFDDGTNPVGTSGVPGWDVGQVQDFAGPYDRDWETGWRNAGTLRGNAEVVQNMMTPGVLYVTSPNPDGIYYPGQTITIWVQFNDTVSQIIGGPPLIELKMDSPTTRFATYQSGVGTDRLVFTYVVQPNDWSWELDYLTTDSLLNNGAIIRNSANGHMNLALPAPGAFGSLGWNKNLLVDPPDHYNPYATWSFDTFGLFLDPDGDEDDDGVSNYMEFLAGTDPFDPDSLLQVESVETVGDQISITWQSVTNRSYYIDTTHCLIAPNWAPLVELPMSGTGDYTTVIFDMPLNAKGFRVRLHRD